MTKRTFMTAFAAPCFLFAAQSAPARTISIDINSADIQSVTPANTDLGNYYVFDVPIPAKLSREVLVDAFLELYVDAASSAAELPGADFTTIEVYPLRSAPAGELQQTDLRSATMKRTVRLGESRKIRINISEHIRHVLDNPAADFGLVVGSLSGQRYGKFTLRNDALGQGAAVRVTVVYYEQPPQPPQPQ